MEFIVTVILLCVILVAAIFFGVLYALFHMTFFVPRKATLNPYDFPNGKEYSRNAAKMIELVDNVIDMKYEDVYITSHDGLKLHARYYEKFENAPLRIMFHGYRSNALRDFCGGLAMAFETGCNALLVDQRAHGKSEGKCLTFGVMERYDCVDWANYASARFGKIKITLAGISMGAATVLMASSLALPDNISGIIADCPYSSPREIICKVIRQRKIPVSIIYPLIRLSGKIFGGFDANSADASKAVSNSNIPILIIHGDKDNFVPWEMSEKIYKSAHSIKHFLTVHNAGHGMSFIEDEDGYKKAVLDFDKGTSLMYD